jgi:hypothetical protein
MTMTLVETITVGSGGAASIEFTGIAGTATDLVVLISGRQSSNGDVYLKFNGSSSGYVHRDLFLNGTTVASQTYGTYTALKIGESVNTTANTFFNSAVYIPNYAGSTAKSTSSDTANENNATSDSLGIWAGSWTGTAAITSISLTGGGNWSEYSTASLYTITKGSGGATVS